MDRTLSNQTIAAESPGARELARAAASQRAILDALPANIALIDATGLVREVNQAWRKFLETNEGALTLCGIGANYLKVCDRGAASGSEEARAAAAGMRRVLAREVEIFTLEYPCHSPEVRRWFQLKVTPLDEPVGGVVAMHIDITERKLAEDARRESDEKYQQLWMNTPDAIVVLDSAHVIRYANPAVRALCGWSPEELAGQDMSILSPPPLREEYRTRLREYLAPGVLGVGSRAAEAIVLHRNGREVPIEISFNTYEEGGSIRFAGFMRDISERKQAAAELHLKTTLLEAQSEAAFDAMLTVSLEGKILGFNKRFTEMWLPDCEDFGEFADDRAALDRVLQKVADPETFLRKIEWLYAHPEESAFDEVSLRDGRILDRYTAPVIDRAGGNHGRIWFFRDITDRRSAERAMEAAQRRLVEASRHAGMAEVASNVLHNVGNVLNSVNVSAEQIAKALRTPSVEHLERVAAMLRDHERDLALFLSADEQGLQIPAFLSLLARALAEEQSMVLGELDSLGRSIDHIREIIAVQQDTARGGGVLQRVQVAEVIEDALRINAPALERHGLRAVLQIDGVPPVLTDKHQVLQILVNLIRNAQDAMEDNPAGEKVLTVRLESAGENAVRLHVSDNGAGISPENLPRLFEHGFTTRMRGHGFGLHSAALLAKALGGSLAGSSEGLGRGATFSLELPLQSPR